MQNPISLIRQEVKTKEDRSKTQAEQQAEELQQKQQEERRKQLHIGWIEHPITQGILYEFEQEFARDMKDLLDIADMDEITDKDIRFRLINLATLSKTINKLKDTTTN